MKAQSGWAIYQYASGRYGVDVDRGERIDGRRRACGVASATGGDVISEEWNRTSALARGIREHRLREAPETRGRDAALGAAEQPNGTAPRAATRLSLVDGGR